MERQQKLLWTILSVAILVLVLMGAGMFFFLPADSTGIAKNGKTATPVEWSKSTAIAPTVASVPTLVPEQYAEASTLTQTVTEEQPRFAPGVTEIGTPSQIEKKTPIPVTKPAPVSTPAVKPAPVRTEVKKIESKTYVQAEKKTPAGSYWIQVGSFGSIDTAEKIKGQLSTRGYRSAIQTVSSNGKTYHRVKVGPYATKTDVDSLLPKIKSLDGMSGSFMTKK